MSARDPHVVLVAHHANPSWGSEPLIGWRWARFLDRKCRLELVTHVRNREAIEASDALRGRVHYVDTEALAARVNRWNDRLWGKSAPVNRLLLETLTQREFDRGAVRVARRLVGEEGARLIHRVSPISPRYPTRLGQLGVPLVVGPWNGGMRTAPGFDEVARRERDGFLAARSLARVLDPFRSTLRSAASILVANETTREFLPEPHRSRAITVCENAVDPALFEPRYERSGRALRVLYLGRLLVYKGVEYLLRAAARASEITELTVDVVGDGPDRARLEALANELGLANVRFHGSVPVDQVPRCLRDCDVLCLPSVRESGGSVPLEAMAAGKPALVADHGGPRETVVDGVGFRLDTSSPAALTADLWRRLVQLSRDEGLRERMGRAAREHVARHYTWDAKTDAALAVYRDCLARRATAAAA